MRYVFAASMSATRLMIQSMQHGIRYAIVQQCSPQRVSWLRVACGLGDSRRDKLHPLIHPHIPRERNIKPAEPHELGPMLPHRAVRARVAPNTRHRNRRLSSASYARVAQSPRERDRYLAEKRRQDAQVLLAQRHGDKREQACARLVRRGGERAE